MPLNLTTINTKQGAILAKNAAAISAAHVNIPTLGTNYTAATLQTWLNTRSNLLESVKTMTDAQITTAINDLYALLTTGGKAIADKILANQPYTLIVVSTIEYERLVKIILYHFATQS